MPESGSDSDDQQRDARPPERARTTGGEPEDLRGRRGQAGIGPPQIGQQQPGRRDGSWRPQDHEPGRDEQRNQPCPHRPPGAAGDEPCDDAADGRHQVGRRREGGDQPDQCRGHHDRPESADTGPGQRERTDICARGRRTQQQHSQGRDPAIPRGRHSGRQQRPGQRHHRSPGAQPGRPGADVGAEEGQRHRQREAQPQQEVDRTEQGGGEDAEDRQVGRQRSTRAQPDVVPAVEVAAEEIHAARGGQQAAAPQRPRADEDPR